MMNETLQSTKVSLGCGEAKKDGFIGVDKADLESVDIIQDLDQQEWELPEDHFTHVRIIDLFEHLENPINFMENVHEICQNGAKVVIRSPHASGQNWTDPTHKRQVGLDTFRNYFTEDGDYDYYSNVRFNQTDVNLQFQKAMLHPWNYILEPFLNSNSRLQGYYEQSFLSRLFPARNVLYKLEVSK